MDTTVKALQNLYVALGGKLTDTYEDICDGATVSNYVLIPDMINAIAKVKALDNIDLVVDDSNTPSVH